MKFYNLFFFFFLISILSAQEIRLSFKIILDNNNSRPSYATEQWINSSVDYANQIFNKYDRGLSFTREPTILIGGSGTQVTADWYTANTSQLEALEAAAEADPNTFQWRENRINIFVNQGSGSARCSSPNPVTDEAILFNSANRNSTLIHEVGHFFNLCHTHGCSCGGSLCDCGSNNPGDDGISSTLPDISCWNQDTIAQFTYGNSYSNCTSNQQAMVDTTFFNIMSYHADQIVNLGLGTDRTVLTYEQFERWVQAMWDFPNRDDVIDGLPIYIDDNSLACLSNCFLCNGSPNLEYNSFDCGYSQVSNDRQLIVIRDGNYEEISNTPLVLDQECIIVSDGQGAAVIK